MGKIEPKLNEVFYIDDVKYTAIEQSKYGCDDCHLLDDFTLCCQIKCAPGQREDGKDIIIIKS